VARGPPLRCERFLIIARPVQPTVAQFPTPLDFPSVYSIVALEIAVPVSLVQLTCTAYHPLLPSLRPGDSIYLNGLQIVCHLSPLMASNIMRALHDGAFTAAATAAPEEVSRQLEACAALLRSQQPPEARRAG
jgi:hypothetical protein